MAERQSRAWILPVVLFVALGAALLFASRGRSGPTGGALPAPVASETVAHVSDDAPPPASAWSPTGRALRHGVAPGDPLARFHGALEKLRSATGPAHVRVLFFGDSHTQGEYLPNAVREALQAKFGDGGPGFLYAGDRGHRSEAATQSVEGLWEIAPKAPSSPLKQGDGIFGLGGILSVGSGGSARVTLSPRVAGRMRVDVCARSVGGRGTVHVVGGASPDAKLGASPSHVVIDAPTPGSVTLELRGDAELCGVVMERADESGVVVDALGISGARFATPLAWDEASFTAEVARRKPDLVVLEYGTNESAATNLHPEEYAKSASDLISRIRRAAPETDCIVIGPTEIEAHPEAVAIVSPAIEAAAEKRGCAFWDTYHVMGGPGSMHAWRTADVQLAGSDGIHLTADGYAKLGSLLAADLLAATE